MSHAASLMTLAVVIFSGQSVISRIYTSRFGNGTFAWNLNRGGTEKKYQVLYPVENSPKVNHTMPYHAVEKNHNFRIVNL